MIDLKKCDKGNAIRVMLFVRVIYPHTNLNTRNESPTTTVAIVKVMQLTIMMSIFDTTCIDGPKPSEEGGSIQASARTVKRQRSIALHGPLGDITTFSRSRSTNHDREVRGHAKHAQKSTEEILFLCLDASIHLLPLVDEPRNSLNARKMHADAPLDRERRNARITATRK